MKNKPTFLIFCLFCTGFPLLGQPKKMQGVWRANLQSTVEKMSITDRNRYDHLPDQVRENISKSFGNRVFHLKTNQESIISFVSRNGLKEVKGTWRYHRENQKLIIENDGTAHEYQVEWQSDDLILLRYPEVPKNAVLTFLCLNRVH